MKRCTRIGVAPDLLALVPGLGKAVSPWATVVKGVERLGVDGVILRSTTTVDANFLEDHPELAWVASATSGIDHLDTAELDRRGVRWTAAPGCNAEAVADWVEIALSRTEVVKDVGNSAPSSLAIVGVGHVGRAVQRRLEMRSDQWQLVHHDPPRARRDPSFSSAPWADVLAADAVTVHVPLDDSTRGLLSSQDFEESRWKVVLNAARGGVIDEVAASCWAEAGGTLMLDVFEGEPTPNPALIAACKLATPHIAGHTLHAKLEGIERCIVWLAQGRPVGSLAGLVSVDERDLLPAIDAIVGSDASLRAGDPFKRARSEALRRRL